MENKKKVIYAIVILAIVIIIGITISIVVLHRDKNVLDIENQTTEILENDSDESNNTTFNTDGVTEMDDSMLEKYN